MVYIALEVFLHYWCRIFYHIFIFCCQQVMFIPWNKTNRNRRYLILRLLLFVFLCSVQVIYLQLNVQKNPWWHEQTNWPTALFQKGPYYRDLFGVLGPYWVSIYISGSLFSFFSASFTRRMSIQSACIQQWVILICLWWVMTCTVIIHICCEVMLHMFIFKDNWPLQRVFPILSR